MELPEGLHRMERPLFDHQKVAVSKLQGWLSDPSQQAGILCLPTGAGKTRTAVAFLLRHVIGKARVLWLAHRTELLNQAIATLLESGHECPRPFTVGRFAAGPYKIRFQSDVVVASIPTLTKGRARSSRNLQLLLEGQRHIGLVVVDECHHGVARSWYRLLQELRHRLPAIRVLGLSATPTRSSAREEPQLWRMFERIVHEENALDLIEREILARPRVIPVPTHSTFDASPAERRAYEVFGDIPPAMVKRIAADERRNASVVRTYLDQRGSWGPTLVFAATVEQGKFIRTQLEAAKVRVADAYSHSRPQERARVVEAFRSGDLDVVVNVGLFTEGTDIPGVKTLFLARPTRSRILFQQMVGRGMRGPRIGGSKECQVVAFYDEVTNLVQEALASTFSTEQEAARALGLANEAEPSATSPASLLPPTAESADARARELQDLIAEIRKLVVDRGTLPDEDRALAGFWEAREPSGSRTFLPVFERDQEAVADWVNGLGAARSPASAPITRWALPESVVRRFVAVARRPDARKVYRTLAESTARDLEAMLAEIGAAVADSRREALSSWWMRSTVKNPVAIDFEGQATVVDRSAYEAFSKLWEQYSEGLNLAGDPKRSEALAWLLVSSPELADVHQESVATLARAGSTLGGIPLYEELQPPDVSAVVAQFRASPRSEWRSVLDRAWEAGLSSVYRTRHEMLLATLDLALNGPP